MADTGRARENAGYTEEELERLTREARRAADLASRLASVSKVDQSALRKLGHRGSVRGRQRALALLLGHRNAGIIEVWSLREACRSNECFNSANFTVNMRKDSKRGLWTCHTHKSRGYGRHLRGYWQLTDEGTALAAEYARFIEQATPESQNLTQLRERLIEVKREVANSIVLTAKTARCPFCREDITADDLARCNSCGNEAHALCLEEFRGTGYQAKRCVLSRTAASCYGEYETIAKPEPEPEPPAPLPAPAATFAEVAAENAALDSPHAAAAARAAAEPTPPTPLIINLLATRTIPTEES